jgi:hypothetical protein
MAILAIGRGNGDVVRRFSMASITITPYRRMVHGSGVPTKRCVTIITRIGGRNVLWPFTRSGAAVVTTGASPRRAFENTFDVTRLAIHSNVLPAEWKTGVKVIEFPVFCGESRRIGG